MATTTTDSFPAPRKGGFRRLISALGRWAENFAEARAQAELLRRLHTMSDAELARLGLDRDSIAFHVFGPRTGL